jgi:hypothetical protein
MLDGVFDNHLEGLPESNRKRLDSMLVVVGKLTERRPGMKLYCGIDLHSNNNYTVVQDEQDRVMYRKRPS